MATALSLIPLGASVLVVDRTIARPTIGETLPPGSAHVLADLGLWDRFVADGHQPGYGNRSVWGGAAPQEYSFIRDAYGNAWHLDRPRFDAMLAAAVSRAGGSVRSRTRVVGYERAGGRWHVDLTSKSGHLEVRAGFLVDATGRSRWLARRQRARKHVHDRLVAAVAVLRPVAPGATVDSFTAVEATREGWWYTAPITDGRLVAGYLTDADIANHQRARTVAGWLALLDHAPATRERVLGGYELEGAIRVISAGTSCLDATAGPGWCAVGDAAAACDPLAARGLVDALSTGHWAAHAIAAAERGGLSDFQERLRHTYARYLAQRLAYYDLERRWPSSPFWERRHQALLAYGLSSRSATGL